MIKPQMEINEFVFPHLGHGIRNLLESKNMSQRELAATTALSSSYISSVVQGSRPISASFARKLEQVFAIDAEDIMSQQLREPARFIPGQGLPRTACQKYQPLPAHRLGHAL